MSYDKQAKRSAYVEKLKDPRWQKKRLEILQRDEFTCQQCFNTEMCLHVHHRIYQRGKEPWDYSDSLLVTLCEECHYAEAESMRESMELLSLEVQARFFGADVLELAAGFNALKMQHTPSVVSQAIAWSLSSQDFQRELIERYFAAIKKRRGGTPHPDSPEAKASKQNEHGESDAN